MKLTMYFDLSNAAGLVSGPAKAAIGPGSHNSSSSSSIMQNCLISPLITVLLINLPPN